MDYELHVSDLKKQKGKFTSLKSSAGDLVDACDSLKGKITGEISSLNKKVEDASKKISTGYDSYETWIEGYVTDLETTENTLASGIKAPALKGDFANTFAKILIPALKSDASEEDKKKLTSLTTMSTLQGEEFFQWMTENNSCGLNAFIMGVNTLLGENKYHSNAEEYAKFGYDTTTIGWGDGKAQQWINNSGLSDKIKVTGEYNVHSKEELYEHLNNGEVVIASSQAYTDSERVFKRKNGDYVNAPNGHYIMFYKNENGVCYANDGGWRVPGGGFLSHTSDEEADNRTAIPYTPEDLDRFFANGGTGSLTLGKV